MQCVLEEKASASVRALSIAYEGLEIDNRGRLNAGKECVFLRMEHDPSVSFPPELPNVVHGGFIYFLVPEDLEKPTMNPVTSPWISDDVCREGEAFTPDSDMPEDSKIKAALSCYSHAVLLAQMDKEAKKLLEEERHPLAGLYASAARIDDTTPMLIDGLIRERGVSVFYGDFDEFKTTVALDMAAHVAVGAPWQGRTVKPRPVIWYALEGADEIPLRLRALESRLRMADTRWGEDRVPITVLDRIPDDRIAWRAELRRISDRWDALACARQTAGENIRYPDLCSSGNNNPLVVVDTLSLALGGDDEKGPRAAGFINDCLDLTKPRPELACPEMTQEGQEEWLAKNPNLELWIDNPVASHVVVIHHQTKTGNEFAGHRAIAANTHGLYRIHRFGKITDARRPYAGQLTPIRTKGILRPSPIRFDVNVVPVEGTKQTAAILKDRATDVPKDLIPAINALREMEDPEHITSDDLNDCLDIVAARGGRSAPAKRKSRQRSREMLEKAGVIEPVLSDNEKIEFYRFHDKASGF